MNDGQIGQIGHINICPSVLQYTYVQCNKGLDDANSTKLDTSITLIYRIL